MQKSSLKDRLLSQRIDLISGANSFTTIEVEREIASVINTAHVPESSSSKILNEFYEAWVKWLKPTSQLDFSGCERKRQWSVCNGIHDALIHQIHYVRSKFKRFYTFKGDYHFYPRFLEGEDHKQITPDGIDEIEPNSYIILSVPHHSGFIPSWLPELLTQCKLNGSRIFLDCAFLGTVPDGKLDTSDEAFDAVAFSISKPFRAGGCRIGIVFSDNLPPTLRGPMSAKYSYWPINSVRIASAVLRKFDALYMPSLCGGAQKEICKELGLEPCQIFYLAVTKSPDYIRFKRFETDYSRICLSPFLIERLSNSLKA